MLLAAAVFLFGANLVLASNPQLTSIPVSRIITSSVKTETHCIDYEDFVYSDYAKAISNGNSSRRFGAVDCLHGDIVLAGTYINLGNRFYATKMLSTPCIDALSDGLLLLPFKTIKIVHYLLHAQVFITLDHMEREQLSKRLMGTMRIG